MDVKKLVKILIGAAWIDGKIQPEEREYLHRVAKEKGIEDDPEIKPLLYELRSVSPDECYRWVEEYLGEHPTSEECQNLIEAISALIYSDGNVANEEAKLLSRLQQLDPANESPQTMKTRVLGEIQKLYRRWVDVQN
ncbi:MAG TPA: TerB family tellurite resistance protein [Leptolyngbyaceae cyanobacterium]